MLNLMIAVLLIAHMGFGLPVTILLVVVAAALATTDSFDFK